MSQIKYKARFKSFTCLAGAAFVLSPLSACTQDGPKDTIAAYELMRKETGQEHSHVEYCENDIVKLTISSRGELATRDLYVPRIAVVHFRNRDTLNTYPLGVRLVADCFKQGASEDCRQGSKIWGVNVSKLGGAKNLLQNDFDLKFFEPTNRRHAELYVSQVSESSRVQRKWNKNDLIYTNFSPIEPVDTLNFPTLYIRYDSHELKRADLKRYVWHITTDEAVRTSRASYFDDLSKWKTYVLEFDALSDKISKDGEFAMSCSP